MNPVRMEMLQLIAEKGPADRHALYMASEQAESKLSVSQSLRQCLSHGELERDAKGVYRLTDLGRAVLDNKREPSPDETPDNDDPLTVGGFPNTEAARDHRQSEDHPDDGQYIKIPRFLNERNREHADPPTDEEKQRLLNLMKTPGPLMLGSMVPDRNFCCAVTSAGWFWLQVADQRIELTVDETRQMLDYLDRTLEPRGSES